MPPLPLRNDPMIDALRSEFVQLYAQSTSAGMAASLTLRLPHLRAYWPMSSVDELHDVYDLSGQGRVLTPVNTPTWGIQGLTSYAIFTKANSEHFIRADETGLNIGSDRTESGFADPGFCGLAWVYFGALGAIEGIISKYNTVGNQRAFRLYKTAANKIEFTVSDNGTATDAVTSVASVVANTWYHVAAVYKPSAYIHVYLNGVKAENVVGIPAFIFASSDPFYLGRTIDAGTSYYLGGRLTEVALSASYCSDAIIRTHYNHTRALFGK